MQMDSFCPASHALVVVTCDIVILETPKQNLNISNQNVDVNRSYEKHLSSESELTISNLYRIVELQFLIVKNYNRATTLKLLNMLISFDDSSYAIFDILS